MRIEPFDPVTADEATALGYAALLAETRRCITPEGTTPPAAYVLNRLRHTGKDFRTALWIAYDGDVPAGAVEAYWREAPDNRDRAWVHLDVPDELATDDLLDALAAAAAAHCVAAGRPLLTVEAEAGSPHSAWVGRRGGRFGSLDEHNVLPLRALSRDDVAALAAAVPDGYELLRWDGAAPDDLVDDYARLLETINDAPTDDLTMEPAVFSPERLRTWEAFVAARGYALWTVVARHVATGELAAYNQVEIRPDWPEVVDNQDTAVAVPHRGHGLGLCVKAVNLLRVLDTLPRAVCVSTWNAASNEHMLRVNRRLGFVREHLIEQWELDAAAVLVGEPVQMRFEQFDPRTAPAADVRAWAAACSEWSEVWAPKGLPAPPEWLVNEAVNAPADKERHWWVAYDGDRVVGGVVMEWYDAPDNRDRAYVHIEVPAARVTPELLDGLVGAAAAVAAPAGRDVLNVYCPSESPVSAWLRARGGTLGSIEQVNVTRFERLDRSDVAALAAATPAGYELVAYDGPVPDDLMDAFIRLNGAMNDAPRDDLTMEDWVFTPERIRAYEAAVAARGHTMWTVVARHVATGELAGFNQLLVYPDWPGLIENEDTGVTEAHRGHGLGRWLKSVNLLRAMDRPGVRCVLTWNAASNDHMLRVNRRLGFECEHVWDSWEIAAPTLA